MPNEPQEATTSSKLKQMPGQISRWLDDSFTAFGANTRNQMRRWRKAHVGYVVLPVSGALPERAGPKRGFLQRRLPLPQPPLSMQVLNARLQAIADAENVTGVLFLFQGLDAGLATLQNFRRSLQRLNEAGKETVVFTPYLDLRHYYAAAAAKRIYAPPGAIFQVLGLRAEVTFLKEALDQIGVGVDVVQVSPYKTAFDTLQHAQMTPEYRDQIDWLLDDQYEMLTAGMAHGRGMDTAAMQALIDEAPHFAEDAVSLGLIDGVAYEDELAYLLAAPTSQGTSGAGDDRVDGAKRPKADLQPWSSSQRLLMERPRRHQDGLIGIVTLEGLINMGASRTPPIDLPIPFVGGAMAGEQTILSLLRRIERQSNLSALILHVDSGGGSALASDLIGREIERLSRKLPILTYMGNVAASGGYYVAANSQHIMSQEATTTGSIGVITLRPSTGKLYEKLRVNRVSIKRGAQAGLYSDEAPMSADERQIFLDGINHSYGQFKQVVASGRQLPVNELDPICEGRVWTGRQALERQLVDSHGDFVDAIREAGRLAGQTVDEEHALRVVNLQPKDSRPIIPQPFEAAEEVSRLLSADWLQALSAKPLWLMPLQIRIK